MARQIVVDIPVVRTDGKYDHVVVTRIDSLGLQDTGNQVQTHLIDGSEVHLLADGTFEDDAGQRWVARDTISQKVQSQDAKPRG